MHNLEMRLRLDLQEWRIYALAGRDRWLACWDRWRPAGGGGLLASATRELGWDEAKGMIADVAAMDATAFRSWHAQTLAEDVQPSAGARVRGRLAPRERRDT
jgi:hypothetical protein